MKQPEEFSEAFEDLTSPFVSPGLARRCKCRPARSEMEWSSEEETDAKSWEAEPEVFTEAVETEGEGEWEDERQTVGDFEDEAPYEPEEEEEVEQDEARAPVGLRARIVDAARQELAAWGQGSKVETDPGMEPRLRAYWAAAGKSAKEADEAIKNRYFWSAAFISYVMRQARAGTAFTGADAHRTYVGTAKRARAMGDSTKFQAFRITEVTPEVGDVLCRDRTSGKKCANTDYDNVDDGTKHAAHCDVVIAVNPGTITTIGGNVSGPKCPGSGCTVNSRQVKVDKRGFVISRPGACAYFAILKAPGRPAVAAPPAPQPAAASVEGFLKDVRELQTVALAPASSIGIDRKWPVARRAVVETYNRVGGLMNALATRLGVELAAVLAVWRVESGGRSHTPGKAIIRFENHLLYKLWGEKDQAVYDNHFRHGGRVGQAGKSWEGHQFRASAAEQFAPVHTGKQGDEYRALELATRLAGENVAQQCISIGGPQILILNHRRLGYVTPRQMYDAFQASERWHVIGFFDFCRTTKAPAAGQMIDHLRDRNWEKFAYYYNGKGQVAKYSRYLADAHQAAQAVAAVPARETEWEDQGEEEIETEWENDPLSETWETPPHDEWEWEGSND